MSGYILRENDPSIVLTADQVDRLVKNGDGDAALLYLLLMRADRGITEQELAQVFRLIDPLSRTYRCIYCDAKAKRVDFSAKE